jgi:predicted HAD superfamily Cof-like phosphohydrolase
MMHDPNAIPNLPMLVKSCMDISGQKTNTLAPQQATMYVGLCFEELGEMVAAIADGILEPAAKMDMKDVADGLVSLADKFKRGDHMGAVGRAATASEEVLDGAIDLAWVALGLVFSLSPNAGGAIAEVARANLDKFPNGVAVRDSNGKWVKPLNWRGPDLSPFMPSKDD